MRETQPRPVGKCFVAKDATKVSPKQETVMKEADLFLQYAEEAMRRASSKSTNADERRALINLACRYSQAALMSERIVLGSSFVPSPPSPGAKGDPPCLLIFLRMIPAQNAASH